MHILLFCNNKVSTEINYMLDKVEMLFKSMGIDQTSAFDELPLVVNIEGYNIHTGFFTT